jgi:hypothetical protein
MRGRRTAGLLATRCGRSTQFFGGDARSDLGALLEWFFRHRLQAIDERAEHIAGAFVLVAPQAFVARANRAEDAQPGRAAPMRHQALSGVQRAQRVALFGGNRPPGASIQRHRFVGTMEHVHGHSAAERARRIVFGHADQLQIGDEPWRVFDGFVQQTRHRR